MVLLLAAATRIHGMAHFPVWTDEGWTAWAIHTHEIDNIVTNLEAERHPPAYFFTLSAWSAAFGFNHTMLRILSVTAGLLTTASIMRLAKDWLGWQAAIYAGALFAVVDSAIYYTQEMRPYSWLILATIWMSLFFLRYLFRPRRIRLICYTFSVIFMLYTQYFGAPVLALHGLFFFWKTTPQQKKGLLIAWGVAGLAYLAWLPSLLRQFDLILADSGLSGYPGSFETTGDGLLELTRILMTEQVAATVALYILGAMALFKQHPRRLSVYLIGTSVGIFIFMAGVNLEIGVLSARTVSFLTPFLMLICGYGLSVLDRVARPVVGATLIGVLLLTTQNIQSRLAGQDVAAALAAQYMRGDLIVLETGADDNALWYEIREQVGENATAEIIRTLPYVKVRSTNTAPVPVVPQISDTLEAHDRIWVIQWLQPSQVMPYLDGAGRYQAVLSREVNVGEEYRGRFGDDTVQLTLFVRRPAADSAENWRFGGLLNLEGALIPQEFDSDSTALHIDLWWTALEPLTRDYSVGVFLLNEAGAVVASQDGPPGNVPTSQWGMMGQFYFDRHSLALPDDLPAGIYRVGVSAYWYGDLALLPVDGQDYAVVGEIRVR